MLRLYHNNLSTCSQKVRLTLAEKGLDFDSVELDLRAGDQYQPEYLKLNPNGVVPTLVNGDDVIVESTVINEYVDDVFPDTSLRPTSAAERARMRLWTKRLDESVHGHTAILSFSIAFRHDFLQKSPDELNAFLDKIIDVRRREHLRMMIEQGMASDAFPPAVQAFDRLLEEMDGALVSSPWLAGNDFSLADIGYAPYITRLEHLDLARWWSDKPHLAAWFQRVKSRPSYSSAVQAWLNEPLLDRLKDAGRHAWDSGSDLGN